MRRFVVGWVLLCFASSAHAQAPVDAMLARVPDDSPIVVVVPSLQQFVSGVEGFAKACEIEDVHISVDDMIEEFELSTAIENVDAIDQNGPMIAFLSPELDGATILLSLTSEAKVTDDTRARVDGRVLTCVPGGDMLGEAGKPSGSFPALFAKSTGGIKSQSTVVAYFDMAKLDETCQQALNMADGMAAMAAMTPEMAGMMPMLQWTIESVRTLVSNAEWVVLTGRIDKQGIHLRKDVGVKADGQVAAYLQKVAKPDRDLLRGLRGKDPLMVYAADWRTPADVETISEQLARVMLKNLDPQSDDYKQANETLGVYRKISGWSGLMTGSSDAGMLIQTTMACANASEMIEELAKLTQLSSIWTSAVGAGVKVETQTSTEAIGSTQTHVYDVTMSTDDPAAQRALDAMFGGHIRTYLFATDRGVSSVGGRPESAKAAAERLIKGDDPTLSDDARVAEAFKSVSDNPQAIVMMDVPAAAMLFSKSMLEGVPDVPQMKAPETPVPFAVGSLYIDGRKLGAELWVPTTMIRAMTKMFEEGGPS